MGCWSHQDRWQNKMERMQYKMERMRGRMERRGFGFGGFGPSSSGNRAFDEYRQETLKRGVYSLDVEDRLQRYQNVFSILHFQGPFETLS